MLTAGSSVTLPVAKPGDGKSYVAANLAAVYAQNGLRSVMVSADREGGAGIR